MCGVHAVLAGEEGGRSGEIIVSSSGWRAGVDKGRVAATSGGLGMVGAGGGRVVVEYGGCTGLSNRKGLCRNGESRIY